jgi:hypothetical protein
VKTVLRKPAMCLLAVEGERLLRDSTGGILASNQNPHAWRAI